MTRKKVLGRGLDALIPQDESAVAPSRVQGATLCPIEDIRPSSRQPRKHIDKASIKELSDSIRQSGIIQPLLVRPMPESEKAYELVAGERRWRAARLAGLESVPVIVREIDDREAMALSLVENLQREDLNPLEEADAYKLLIEDFGFKQDELAQKVGKDRSTISNSLRLLKLPDKVKKYLLAGQITEGHARAILTMSSQATMEDFAAAIIEQKLSVRAAEDLAATWTGKGQRSKRGKTSKTEKQKSAFIKDIEDKLKRALGTKVKIFHRPKKGGKLEIYYYSDEELERIIGLVQKQGR